MFANTFVFKLLAAALLAAGLALAAGPPRIELMAGSKALSPGETIDVKRMTRTGDMWFLHGEPGDYLLLFKSEADAQRLQAADHAYVDRVIAAGGKSVPSGAVTNLEDWAGTQADRLGIRKSELVRVGDSGKVTQQWWQEWVSAVYVPN